MIYEGEQNNTITLQLSQATLGKSSKTTPCLHRPVHNTHKILQMYIFKAYQMITLMHPLEDVRQTGIFQNRKSGSNTR